MHTRLTIPERLKDLRVAEKRMSLQELSDATGIPSSTLGNYEKDENVDMSLGNLLTLADFYHVSTDYLLCRTELREHTNKSVSDLHLNDDAVQILTDEKYNPRLLSELLSHTVLIVLLLFEANSILTTPVVLSLPVITISPLAIFSLLGLLIYVIA